MSDTLWAPWRMDYILGPKPDGCVFCAALAAGPDKRAANLVLAMREHSFVIMNRYPYTHAHIMILPRRHVSGLADLSGAERAELFELVGDAQATLARALAPPGMNLGMNLGKAGGAGIDDHIHMHIVPRWPGDTNFMPLLADCRTMPEHLDETYGKLSASFGELDRGAW